jgi:hypothetical protein
MKKYLQLRAFSAKLLKHFTRVRTGASVGLFYQVGAAG